jgi:intracellular septation protein
MFTRKMLRHVVFSAVLEFGPVIIFLLSYGYTTVYESTFLLMVATIISTFTTYHLQKRIPYLALYVAMITVLFGYMTIHFQDVKFIQMRDTLYDLTCAVTLLVGMLFNVVFLRVAFGEVIPMSRLAWVKLTYFWIAYFTFIAISNEFARRLLDLDSWFVFKECSVLLTTLFGFFALYYCFQEKIEGKD